MSRLMMSKSRRSMPLLDRRTGCIAAAVPVRAPLIRIPSVFLPVLCVRTLGAIRTPTFASRCGATITVTTSQPLNNAPHSGYRRACRVPDAARRSACGLARSSPLHTRQRLSRALLAPVRPGIGADDATPGAHHARPERRHRQRSDRTPLARMLARSIGHESRLGPSKAVGRRACSPPGSRSIFACCSTNSAEIPAATNSRAFAIVKPKRRHVRMTSNVWTADSFGLVTEIVPPDKRRRRSARSPALRVARILAKAPTPGKC
jgi:hypothetical protein